VKINVKGDKYIKSKGDSVLYFVILFDIKSSVIHFLWTVTFTCYVPHVHMCVYLLFPHYYG